jgi:hypothetical protein
MCVSFDKRTGRKDILFEERTSHVEEEELNALFPAGFDRLCMLWKFEIVGCIERKKSSIT